MAGDGRIIPVWHNVGPGEVIRYSPTLADAVSGNTRSLDKLAIQIASVARPDLFQPIMRKVAFAQTVGKGEIMESPASNIRQGPIRHATLPNDMVNRIDLIRTALLEVVPHSRNEWMDGFQRDAHPSKEVEVWEAIAARYSRAVEARQISDSGKQAIFQMLLLSSLGSDESAAEILFKEFGDRAQAVFDRTRYDKGIFTPISNEDRRRQAEINVEIQDLSGPGASIDLAYIEEIVVEMSRKDTGE
ncbi:MAG TPA: hypothetical protein VEC11_04825 [Allosphingosinicella sp.]|nr:hypothetical protein [Allosphingosinicella sp.]